MSGRRSREKGKRGERELAAILAERGFPARRGVQYSGGGDSPDVVAETPGLHWEAKRCERLALWPAIEQASEEAGGKVPVVAHRPNRRPWVVVLPLERFLDIYRTSDMARDK